MGCAQAPSSAPANAPVKPPPVKQDLMFEYLQLLKDKGLRISRPDDSGGWGNSALTPDDSLLIIDMQNDFLPADVAPQGGRFGVAEGGACILPIIKLIEQYAQQGAFVVATRDYHPHDHCSFNGYGGPFPAHCVQGSAGSFFHPSIGKALLEAQRVSAMSSKMSKKSFGEKGGAVERFPRPNPNSRVEIVFKGFCEEVESFGGIEYGEQYFKDRGEVQKHMEWNVNSTQYECVSCAGPWTGCYSFKCSALGETIDAPPDLMAVLSKEKRKLHDMLPRKGRLLVVGLAFDFCVLDTAVNAAKLGFEKVFICIEAVRAAHIPGIGQHGSGFLSPPEALVGKFKDNKIGIISIQDLLGSNHGVPGLKCADGDRATE
jgi:nicotinamidase-related amidase